MDFQIETQGANVFLVYEVGASDVFDEFCNGMISNNKVIGLNKFAVIHADNKIYIKYNVSGKISLKQFFAGVVNRSRFITVITSILSSIIDADQYMLELSQFVLDPNYIYCSVSNGQAELVYLPIERKNAQFSFSNFIKEIMFDTQFNTDENCDYLAKIIGYINANQNLVLTDLRNFIASLAAGESNALPIKEAEIYDSAKANISNSSTQAVYTPAPSAPVQTPPVTERKEKFYCGNCGRELKANEKFCSLCGKQQANETINIPGKPAVPSSPVVPAATEEAKPKKRGLFGWMKKTEENKKEKENKKAKEKPNSGKAKPSNAPNMGFAVPGQNVPPKTPTSIAQSIPVSSPAPSAGQNVTFGTLSSTMQNTPNTVQGNFGETTVLTTPSGGETTVLGPSQQEIVQKPYIVRKKNNQKMFIEKNIFRIGKEKSYVDFFIGDNTAISRSHADIITRDGEYFIIDNNSTNNTYMDGVMIPKQTEIKIEHGANLKLANEEFEFRLF